MMQKKKSSESEELYGELGHAFNFTQGDLEANRAGFLSFRQMKRPIKWNSLLWLLAYIFAILFFAALGLIQFWGIYEIVLKITQYPLVIALLGIAFAVFLLFISLFFFGIAYLAVIGANQELKTLRNKNMQRKLNNYIVRKSSESTALESTVGGLFSVSEDAYQTLEHEQLYRLYFFDDFDGLHIYSIETISALISDEESAANFADYKEKHHAKEEN